MPSAPQYVLERGNNVILVYPRNYVMTRLDLPDWHASLPHMCDNIEATLTALKDAGYKIVKDNSPPPASLLDRAEQELLV